MLCSLVLSDAMEVLGARSGQLGEESVGLHAWIREEPVTFNICSWTGSFSWMEGLTCLCDRSCDCSTACIDYKAFLDLNNAVEVLQATRVDADATAQQGLEVGPLIRRA